MLSRQTRIGLLIVVLMGGGFGLWRVVVLPRLVPLFAGNRMEHLGAAAQELSLAMRAASVGGNGFGYPADCGAKSTAVYLEQLVGHGYLQRDRLALLNGLMIANVARTDSDRTVLVISRPYYEYVTQGARFPKEYVFIRKTGEVDTAREPIDAGDFPPRDPAFLTP